MKTDRPTKEWTLSHARADPGGWISLTIRSDDDFRFVNVPCGLCIMMKAIIRLPEHVPMQVWTLDDLNRDTVRGVTRYPDGRLSLLLTQDDDSSTEEVVRLTEASAWSLFTALENFESSPSDPR